MSYLQIYTHLREGRIDEARELARSLASGELLQAFDQGQLHFVGQVPTAPFAKAPRTQKTRKPKAASAVTSPAASASAAVGEHQARTPYKAAPQLVDRETLRERIAQKAQSLNLSVTATWAYLGFQSGLIQNVARGEKPTMTHWASYLAEQLGHDILVQNP